MDRAMQEISVFLNSRPQSPATDPKALLYAFGIAIDGIDPQAVIKTCRRYIRGEVKDDDRRFAPSSAEFAYQCKQQQAADEYASRPKILQEEEGGIPQLTEQQMAARRAQVRELLGPSAAQG